MRVLLVTNDWPPDVGGIQTYLTGLVARTSHDVRVLAPRHPDAEPSSDEVRRTGFMWPTRRIAERIEAEASDFGADVVWFGAPTPPALLGPRLDLPYVVLCHGAEVSTAAAIPLVRGRLRRSLAGAGEVLAVSEHTAGLVARFSGRVVHRLGVGVTLSGAPVPSERPPGMTVVSVGRLVRRKGLDRLIDALARVPGWHGRLVLVGDGPDRDRLGRRANRRGVALEVRTGLDDAAVRSALREGDVFAQPCRTRLGGLDWEGLGIVFLEAAAEGLPVIAGRSGGAPETIKPGVTGFLAGSRREVIAAIEALGDSDRATAMGGAGREMVEAEWGWEAVIERFDAAIDRAAQA
ncbi:MAG: glycosyltransferase family 4 protein [Acidimicrobiia bacterium]|nr:glycosyltransferase family 4 protein [Acidimicrobiia bacterium]